MINTVVAIARAQNETIKHVFSSFLQAFDHHSPTLSQCVLSKDVKLENGVWSAKDQKKLDEIEEFNSTTIRMSRECIADLSADLRHNTLHCLNWGSSLRNVCGFNLQDFGMLLALALPALIILYPNCDIMAEPDERLQYASLRFKFFITLYYLHTGTPFRVMEVLFGWSDSVLSSWTHRITQLIADVFRNFRAFPSPQDQLVMALEHATYCAGKGANIMRSYGRRINYSRVSSLPRLVFNGAVGAIDGTFTLCCRFSNDIQEFMYTGYKKFHAYKLVVVCSLFTKVVLAIFVEQATTSDNAAWTHASTILAEGLHLLGDAAFHGLEDVISPFRTEDINLTEKVNPALTAQMREFNTVLY
jgi:hypothetical protein